MRYYRMIGLLLALALGTEADASQNTAANVTFIFGMRNEAMLFHQSGGPRSSLPSCASGNPDRWAMDATTAAGQNKLSVLLTAKALHKVVQVYGTNACSVWGDTETVDYLVMND